MHEFISSLLNENPYFSAGFGLLGVGAILTGFRQGLVRLAFLTQRRYLTTVEVTSKDPAYIWITQWLAKQVLSSGSHFTATARFKKPSSSDNLPINLSPAPGVHFFRSHGAWIKVNRDREKSALMDLTTGVPFETITMSVIGRRPMLFQKIFNEAQSEVAKLETGKLIIYTSWAAEWRQFGTPRRKRPLDSVIFEQGLKEALISDVKEFLTSSQWYLERGIPYRRGYLLYGPPGGGKSSFIQALASELDYNICLLNLSESSLSDDRLCHLLNVLPERSILLLEDIDSAMHAPEKAHGKLTFSGLLNALDGVASSEERLIFMTTNHYNKLDPALIRPGRVDYQQYIGPASKEQILRMFQRFYPNHLHLADSFADCAAILEPSPAAIQGLFIQHKSNPVEALENLSLLSKSCSN